MSCAVCPHCGYDLERDAAVEDGDFRYEPRLGLFYRGWRLPLGPSRTLILAALMRARGRTLTRSALEGVVGNEDPKSNLIATQLCRTRAILAEHAVPFPVENIWGEGWRWKAEAAHRATSLEAAA